jgi:ferredoxin
VSAIISSQALLAIADAWLARGGSVAGPSRVKPDLVLYRPIQASAQLLLDGFIHPQNSIKEFFLPRHEPIYTYRFKGKKIELGDIEPPGTPRLILAARPCDAAMLPILDRVFNWDYQDKFYNRRREAATVVALACTAFDDNCFCTSVGITPSSERGADALLLPLGDGSYEVRCLTDKGTALFAGQTTPGTQTGTATPGPEKRFDLDAIRTFLQGHYEDPAWQEIALRCLGCGACAYTCPTCHCFDIVDEGTGAGGARVKNWDCCQFGQFTLHASGHNPRTAQAHRQRQRTLHKFSIYPEKFGENLCTGCGNCTRNCPVSLGILTAMDRLGRSLAAPRAPEKPAV